MNIMNLSAVRMYKPQSVFVFVVVIVCNLWDQCNPQQRPGHLVSAPSRDKGKRQRELRTKHKMCSVALMHIDKKIHRLICVTDIVKCALF